MILDRIFYVCETGCPWRNLEVSGASATTVHYWSKLRVFERAFSDLRATYLRLPRVALIADLQFCEESLRQGRHRAKSHRQGPKGNKATKVSLLADERRAPIHVCFHRGNRSDCQTLHLNAASSETGPVRAASCGRCELPACASASWATATVDLRLPASQPRAFAAVWAGAARGEPLRAAAHRINCI